MPRPRTTLPLSVLALAALSAPRLSADDAAAQAPAGRSGAKAPAGSIRLPAEKPLAERLVGAWAYAGTAAEPKQPAAAGPVKLFAGGHWSITDADPETGAVKYHHGGTYGLEGDEYAERVRYANENTASLVGRTLRFKIAVEGDTLTATGIDDEYAEIWKRAK